MIAGLFTELLSAGGVQTAGRHTAAVLSTIARERGVPYRFLSLNDPSGDHECRVSDLTFDFRGFNRGKGSFALAAMKLALHRPSIMLAAHPNLVSVATAMKALAPAMHVLVMSHGIEVWKPLPAFRRWALRRATRVLAPSVDTAKKLAVVQGVGAKKICRLPWGLDPDFLTLAEKPRDLPRPLGFPDGLVLLTVGRWVASEQYKGVDDLIRVLPCLLEMEPDFHLVAVGEGDDRPRLERLAQELGVGQRVHFLNWAPKNKLAACYARCDIFALPSGGEGFGLVFLEAMALEKPVVGGAPGGTRDLIENGVNGFLVPHGDVESLAGVLRTLLIDEGLRYEMGRKGRAHVLSDFRFENFREGLKKIVADVDSRRTS
jgi:phosphatidylinositol alpha-1,6-mannosyltransferase